MNYGSFKSFANYPDKKSNITFGTGLLPINIKIANLETFAKAENKQQGYEVAEVSKLISTMLTGWSSDGNKPKSMSDNYLELILSCGNGVVVKKRLQFPHIIPWQDESTQYNIANVYKPFIIDNWLKADDFENPDITLAVEPVDEIITTDTSVPIEATTTNSGRFYLYYRNLPVGINRVHIEFHIKTKTEPIDFDLEVIDGNFAVYQELPNNKNLKYTNVKEIFAYTGAEGNFEDITMFEWNALYYVVSDSCLDFQIPITHDLFFVLYESETNADSSLDFSAAVKVPDYSALPLLCGQPPILYGEGTPQESVVPLNWKQFDPITNTGYNWNGTPSALGQTYINISATSNGRYTAVPDVTNPYNLKWVNF